MTHLSCLHSELLSISISSNHIIHLSRRSNHDGDISGSLQKSGSTCQITYQATPLRTWFKLLLIGRIRHCMGFDGPEGRFGSETMAFSRVFPVLAQRSRSRWWLTHWHIGRWHDIMINSMAALLALKKHAEDPSNCKIPDDRNLRMKNAEALIQRKIDSWDVESSEHVGYEIVVPTLLHLLQAEGICFHFPGLQVLMALNAEKMGKFAPHVLYSSAKNTLLHSLEGFIGKIDFDKLSHLKVSGSMMCSPASTAAYLMNSSLWDEEAEQYLSRVVSHGYKTKIGSVPSAFPTPIFELTWVCHTRYTRYLKLCYSKTSRFFRPLSCLALQ